MYAIFVGTKQNFLLDSVWEEDHIIEDPLIGDGASPSFRVRIDQMIARWRNRGEYIHPQSSNSEVESLLGYSSQGGTASSMLEHFRTGFFAFVVRENAGGELHLWNSRYAAVYEFNVREDALEDIFVLTQDRAAWYVRTLSYPGTLETWCWDGSYDTATQKAVINRNTIIRIPSEKQKRLGLHRIAVSNPTLINCVQPNMKWTVAHLNVLRTRKGEQVVRNLDRKPS